MVKISLKRLGPDHIVVGEHQLQAHVQRQQPAERQEDQRGDDVAAADLLVIDGAEPADEAPRPRPSRLEPVRQLGPGEVGPVAQHAAPWASGGTLGRRFISASPDKRRTACSSFGARPMVGMLVARLLRLRIGDPAVEVAAFIGSVPGARWSGGWRDGSGRGRPGRRRGVPAIVWHELHSRVVT